MATTTNVKQVKLNIMTQSQYNSATKNANELYMLTDAKVDYNDLSNKPTIPTVNNPTITITQGGVTKGSFTLNQSSGDTIALDAGGSSYTAGDGIDITSNVISNKGVRSVSSGTTNGTISVNTNGTSAEVAVAGLGSAAYTSSTDYLTPSDVTSTYSSTGTDPVNGTAVASAISGRADTDLSNLSSDGEKWVARVGMMIPFGGSTAPSGWLICDGSAVSRTTYASLFAVIGTTYGTGDGSTTFNLPNFVDKTFWGGSTSGTVKSAGLPNITGDFATGFARSATGVQNGIIRSASGAFSLVSDTDTRNYATSQSTTTATYHTGANFNASSSNSIYGNSTTVQPPAIQTLIIIKY